MSPPYAERQAVRCLTVSQRAESSKTSQAGPEFAGRERSQDGEAPGEQVRRERGLTRRTWTLIFSFVLVVVLGLIGTFARIPYVALGAGPTYDTLGNVGKTQVVAISGTKVYPTSGQLRMTTVSLTDSMTLFGAVGLWLSGRQALAPREEFYPSDQTRQQVEQQNVQQFQQSQSNAEVAALRYLHYPIQVRADQIVKRGPSDGKILPGDQMLEVNGKKIVNEEDPYNSLVDTKPGQVVSVVVQSGNSAPRTVQITLGTRPDRSPQGFLGVKGVPHAEVPFHIKINLSDVGGPSAGLMFALAIIDKLTPDELAGNRTLAGTGEINAQGQVLPIGGIPFKLIAARDAGATVFLVPAQNCSEAASKAPSGLRLVKVDTLDNAVRELQDLKAGKPVPSCG